MIPIIQKAKQHLHQIAIQSLGKSYTYQQLLESSEYYASILLQEATDLNQQRVLFMVKPGFNYVMIQWAIWIAGGVAVPLSISSPFQELAYVIKDTEASLLVIDKEFEDIIQPTLSQYPINIHILENERIYFSNANRKLPESISLDRMAMILYTSGTTSMPKGVVTTHANIVAQITVLIDAWEWTEKDYTLCVLPLHHIHGIINVVCCSLWAGACCEFLPKFDASHVFRIFGEGKLTLFMAVPTIYFKLIHYWEELSTHDRFLLRDRMENQRVMVCGSAALPVSLLKKWKKISGHTLLERYGMTEIGMALSNRLKGRRFPGYVGKPLPNMHIRIADDSDKIISIGLPGEIQVKGPSVFKEYWKKADETRLSFTEDGWFKTGDIGIIENNNFKILGRNSIDIIKSGAYKISALEIEEHLRDYKNIAECSVIGLPDDEWGEIVCAVLVEKMPINLSFLKRWLRNKLSSDKIPRRFEIITELPRNSMGKVSKKELIKRFGTYSQPTSILLPS
jgi:malonyl-CoA/methylmalonyl-CoA synthetase